MRTTTGFIAAFLALGACTSAPAPTHPDVEDAVTATDAAVGNDTVPDPGDVAPPDTSAGDLDTSPEPEGDGGTNLDTAERADTETEDDAVSAMDADEDALDALAPDAEARPDIGPDEDTEAASDADASALDDAGDGADIAGGETDAADIVDLETDAGADADEALSPCFSACAETDADGCAPLPLPAGTACGAPDSCAVDAVCDGAGACVTVPTTGTGSLDRAVEIDIGARRLDDGVQDAVWDVVVRRAGDPAEAAPVFSTRVAASLCGTTGPAAVINGACGEGDGDRVVTARVRGLYAAPVLTLLGPVGAPAPSGALPFNDPGDLVQIVPCAPEPQVNKVSYDVAIARPTYDGIFTQALNFDAMYCAANFTCCDDSDDDGVCDADRLLLFAPGGQRGPTFSFGFTCAAATDPTMDLALYLDDLVLTCDDGAGTHTVTVHPLGGDGNLCAAGDLGNCATSKVEVGGSGASYAFQAAVYKGDSSFGGVDRVWWNLALGVDKAALAGATCTLTARATADNHVGAGGAQGGVIAAGDVYPVVTWNIAVSSGGALTCAEHPLDDGVTHMVTTVYTVATPPTTTTLPWGYNP